MDNLSDWVKDETPNRDFWKPTKEGETLEGVVVEKKAGLFGVPAEPIFGQDEAANEFGQ